MWRSWDEPPQRTNRLHAYHDRAQGYVAERVSTRFASTADADGNPRAAGDLIYAITRTTYGPGGTAQEVERTVVPADQCELVYEAPAK